MGDVRGYEREIAELNARLDHMRDQLATLTRERDEKNKDIAALSCALGQAKEACNAYEDIVKTFERNRDADKDRFLHVMGELEDARETRDAYMREREQALRAFGEFACTVMAESIAAISDAAIVSQKQYNEETALRWMRKALADLAKQRDEALAHVETLREALEVAEKIMHDANDALESDATVEDRRAVFERVQDYFDPRERGGFGNVLASTPAQSIAEHDKAVEARVAERCLKWAEFGAWAFESFWHDGEPGDLEGGDLQERAVALGLLGRTAEHDAGATHAEGCEWQPGMPVEDCDCYAPLAAPFNAAAIRREFGVTR